MINLKKINPGIEKDALEVATKMIATGLNSEKLNSDQFGEMSVYFEEPKIFIHSFIAQTPDNEKLNGRKIFIGSDKI